MNIDCLHYQKLSYVTVQVKSETYFQTKYMWLHSGTTMKCSSVLYSAIGLFTVVTVAGTKNISQFDPASYASHNVIIRDVAIVGGGSTGTYGAVTLNDLQKSTVVIEREPILGGQTNTYTVPSTGQTVDYGVQRFWNIPIVTNFFDRLSVPFTTNTSSSNLTTVYMDFKTGQSFSNFSTSSNLSAYEAQLAKYPFLLWGWDFPDPIPSDLLLPFADFIKKYSLEYDAFSINSEVGGDLLSTTTVNVFMSYGEIEGLQSMPGGSVVTANHDNHEIYAKALADLGANVLLESTVTAAQRARNSSGIQLVVKTPTGNKLIMASQLLVTIPTEIDNMAPFDLDEQEQSLFKQVSGSGYWLGLFNNTGLPAGYSFVNVGSDTLYNLPTLPGLYRISQTAVDGIFVFWYGSDSDDKLSDDQIRRDALATIKAVSDSVSNTTSLQEPELLAFASHTPFRPSVPASAIENGFWKELYGLQGYRNTWYTGAQFLPGAGQLWNYTQTLVTRIVNAI